MSSERCMAKGFLTGMVAGLAASWAMNQFWAVQSSLKQASDGSDAKEQEQERASDNPTVKVAEFIVRPLLGREMAQSEKKIAGAVVHYAFGALVGGLYGILTEAMPAARAGFGTAYGTVVWLGADEAMVPALKLSPPPQEASLSQHLSGLSAHLVYGAATEAVRRTLRAAA